ncbi:MAG TPA: ATP-binding protein [Verrucomicrobiae bacterium]|nr:ATP-binding protein [Verrucomicrobiae bacterium]
MFQTSTPVVGKGFHNRASELEALSRSMQRLVAGEPRWIAILGPRKIGKTSLVLEAARRARTDTLRVITLDVQEQGPASLAIFRRLALEVLDAAVGRELGESLERLSGHPAAYRKLLQKSDRFGSLPDSLRSELLELVEGEINTHRAGAWLDLPEQLAAHLGLFFVIALDEFQELEGLRARKEFNAFMFMRSRWQKHRRVSYFISGSARSMLLKLVQSQQSPFFQHFALQELGPFRPDDAVDLLQQESGPEKPISSEVAELAVKAIGGYPFYLQMLGEELVESPSHPSRSSLKTSLQKLLFSRTGRLALYFESEFQKLVGRSTSLAATLDALAEGPASLTAISRTIGASTGPTVTYLERLQDAVERTAEGLYRLADPTFGLWLRWRRPGGTIVPMSVVGDEAEKSAAGALSAMGFDLVYQSKGSRGAFDLLATHGALQLGIQVKRSPLPLRFNRNEWSRMVAEGRGFRWHWIVASVSPSGEVNMLDPTKASVKKGITLSGRAVISNLLLWLDQKGPVA